MSTYSIDLIPWQGMRDWQEVVLFFDTIEREQGHALGPVRLLARKIRFLLDALSDPIDKLCGSVCPDCMDICCERATIWYDFKDILYLYFGLGILPDSQIKKVPGQTRLHCINLAESGCRLPRSQRPFVCTWYFCPDQTLAVPHEAIFFSTKIDEMKVLRHEMEKVFCCITAL